MAALSNLRASGAARRVPSDCSVDAPLINRWAVPMIWVSGGVQETQRFRAIVRPPNLATILQFICHRPALSVLGA
tara:strand:- start:66203 stop:66427 length:225 start_codon:yes stop_codon:yes gene_type:complete